MSDRKRSNRFATPVTIVAAATVFLYGLYEFLLEKSVEQALGLNHHENMGEKIESFLVVVTLATILALLARQSEARHRSASLRLAQNEEDMRLIATAAHDAIILVDHHCIVTYWNKAAETLFGYSAGEIIGKDVAETIIPERFREAHLAGLAHLAASSPFHPSGKTLERPARRKSGEEFVMEMSLSIVPTEEAWRGVAVIRDVTQRTEANEQLQETNQRLESALQEKERYVSLIAHDLKGPFASMMTFLCNLDGDFTREPTNAIAQLYGKAVKKVLTASEHSLATIDEVLNVSRFRSGAVELNFCYFDGHRKAAVAIATHQPQADEKGVTLVNDVPPDSRMYGDPALFVEVLKNLVSNAIKFCRSHDTISLFIPPGLDSGVAVRDSGAGVDKSLADDLFRHDRKTTLPGTAGERGTGLGLPLAADIMEAHNGSLTLESTPGRGAVFYARLPHRSPKAMVVNDDEIQLVVLSDILRRANISVTGASNGVEALEHIARAMPDIIITDMNMPRMGGLELLTQVKGNQRTRKIPIILCTATEGAQSHARAYRLGADDFMPLPVLSDDLIRRINRFLA